jgi:hypothetical protein
MCLCLRYINKTKTFVFYIHYPYTALQTVMDMPVCPSLLQLTLSNHEVSSNIYHRHVLSFSLWRYAFKYILKIG